MKKKILILVSCFLISFIVSLLFEIICVNRRVLGKKTDNNPEIVEMHNIEKNGDNYVTTDEESYIIIKSKSNYINKIRFNYDYDFNILWSYIYKDNGKEYEVICSSSSLINTAVKKVYQNVDTLKIKFNNKDLKIKSITIDNDIFIYWYRVIAISLILFVISSLIVFRKKIKSIKIHNLFLGISLLLGTAFILIAPKTVYTNFDDQIHFDHVLNPFNQNEITYSKAEEIVVSGYKIRESEHFSTREEKMEVYKKLNNLHKESKYRTIDTLNERSFYGNIVYIPYYVGYKFANMLNLSFTTCFMIGKLFNLLLYSFLFYLAIKYAKHGKKILFLIGLIPECMFFTTQYSYDGTIIAGLSLATACIINLFSDDKINKKYIIVFILATLWASLPKALYGIFLLLLLFIPNKRFNSKKQAFIFKSLIIMITGIVLMTFLLPTATGQMTGDSRGGNTSVNGQIEYIKNNKVEFIKNYSKFSVTKFWSNSLGEKNFIYTPYLMSTSKFKVIYYAYLIVMFYYAFTSHLSSKFKNKYKLLLGLEVVGVWLLFCAALYLKFTEIGSNSISGIQPRYLLPMFMALFCIFMPRKDKEDTNNDYLYLFASILYISTIIIYMSFKVV